MQVHGPLAIADNSVYAYLRAGAGDQPETLSIFAEEDVRFRTFQGAPYRLPSCKMLTTTASVLLRQAEQTDFVSIELRDAIAVEHNNLAAARICAGMLTEALESLVIAETHLLGILDFFATSRPSPALVDRAVVLYNAAVVHIAVGEFSRVRELATCAQDSLDEVQWEDRGAGYGFVEASVAMLTGH